MRHNYELRDVSNNIIDLDVDSIYSYSDSGAIVKVSDNPAFTDDIIFSRGNIRDGKQLTLRNLNILFNRAMEKSTKAPISLNKIVVGPVGTMLVSQGPGSSPAWKTFESIFPTEVYQVESDTAIILQSSTMLATSFINNPTILRNEYTSDATTLETKEFLNSKVWLSHKVELGYTPVYLPFLSQTATDMTIDKSYPLTFNKPNRFIIEDINGNIREVKGTPTYVLGNYKIMKSEIGWTGTDSKLYLADHIVRTSMVASDFEHHNNVTNEIESVKSNSTYDIEVWGDVNSFSSTVPLTTGLIHGCIGDGFGILINNDNIAKGFGSNLYGQINNVTDKVKYASCGKTHSCLIALDGTLISLGSDKYGQVSNTPDGKFKKVVCGDYVTAAISENNELFIWGDILYKYDDITFSTFEVKDISFGKNFFILQRTDGTLEGYGDNTYGQITNIPSGSVLSFDCGDYHCAAVTSFNTLELWGSNSNLQISYTGVKSGFSYVQCGDYYTVALKSDGTAVTFGNDSKKCVSGVSTVQKYNMICANYDNVLGFKNKVFKVKDTYVKKVITGQKFSLQIAFSNKGTVLNSVVVHLENEK